MWGDRDYDTVTTTSPSHIYDTGSGVYSVSVSADDSDGGYESSVNTVTIGSFPFATA